MINSDVADITVKIAVIIRHTMQQLKGLQDSVKQIENLYRSYEDIGLLIEMCQEESEEDTIEEIQAELETFEEEFEELRIQTLLTEPCSSP